MKNAIIITAGHLVSSNGKTAHGLIRGTERFNIVGVIDEKWAGKDAGEVLDGKNRNIPVYASLKEFADNYNLKLETFKQDANDRLYFVYTKL